MILVDTNVLSQLTRPNGERRVVSWIDANFPRLHVPALVVSELFYGAHAMVDAGQRDALLLRTELALQRFEGRLPAFDDADARLHGRLAGECARRGVKLAPVDGRLAAMALRRGWAIATRNVRDFEPAGVRVIDPWAEAG